MAGQDASPAWHCEPVTAENSVVRFSVHLHLERAAVVREGAAISRCACVGAANRIQLAQGCFAGSDGADEAPAPLAASAMSACPATRQQAPRHPAPSDGFAEQEAPQHSLRTERAFVQVTDWSGGAFGVGHA